MVNLTRYHSIDVVSSVRITKSASSNFFFSLSMGVADRLQLNSRTSRRHWVWMKAHLRPMMLLICGERVIKLFRAHLLQSTVQHKQTERIPLTLRGFTQVVKLKPCSNLNLAGCRLSSCTTWSPSGFTSTHTSKRQISTVFQSTMFKVNLRSHSSPMMWLMYVLLPTSKL